MRKKLTAAHAAAWLLGGATFAVSGVALADNPACPVNANTVYISGSSAFAPVYQGLVNAFGGAIEIVGFTPGSCEGLDDVLKPQPETVTSATVYAAGVATSTCTNTSSTIDIGASDVYLNTCASTFDPTLPSSLPAGFADNLGPVQAMTIAVPYNSTQNMISAEAAKMVFGFGAAAGMQIMPWTDPNTILVRFYDSGTLEMIGTAINLPGGKWKNASPKATAGAPIPQQASSGGNMAGLLSGYTTMGGAVVNTGIGILATSNLASATAMTIKPLAFQGTGQTCSYLPDSSASTNDKINVRQGRYQIWGPEHLVTKVDGSGKPVGLNGNTAAVQAVINGLLSSSQALPASSDAGAPDAGIPTTLTEDQVGTIIAGFSKPSVGFIPECAMQVSRTAEIGAEASYAPPSSCGCYYEQQTTVVSGACDACTVDSDCKKPAATHCHFHYCEAE